MDLLQLLVLLILVGICAAIAEWIIGYTPGGLIVTIIVGVIGAYLGAWLSTLLPFQLPLFSWFTVEVGTTAFNMVWAVVGSILLLLLLNVMRTSQLRRQAVRP
ncbi:MAG TPA: GlsB/YeaQ/YmgE family stress response membrane protein [Roseiflexaceae bacterium]|nr:GlsB/YeaQ/YmgE family stress response membrane protein [Roseiflexaceae bacterium]